MLKNSFFYIGGDSLQSLRQMLNDSKVTFMEHFPGLQQVLSWAEAHGITKLFTFISVVSQI